MGQEMNSLQKYLNFDMNARREARVPSFINVDDAMQQKSARNAPNAISV